MKYIKEYHNFHPMPHIHEKIDFCVECYIVNDNTVLLRYHDKYNLWLSVGGHIELDEDPVEAILREIKEEVGITDITIYQPRALFDSVDEPGVKDKIPPYFMYRHHVNKTHEHVAFVYFASTTQSQITQGPTEKTTKVHWFTKEDLNDKKFGVNDRIRYYALEALRILKK